ncbi:hypothetical protein [Qipengyuania sp. MTN3-11]|uniref:hypothetical protein n=1 Tax=Qipengyuania sp. MTN3-11 TaxID=3056557 RepID=UPI0036F1BE44
MTALNDLQRNWDYRPSKPSALVRAMRLRSRLRGWNPAPEWRALRTIVPAERWNGLFLFAPNGRIDPTQTETVRRIKALKGRAVVILAAPDPTACDDPALRDVEALYWKALGGYDFSAYGILLREVAARSPGAMLYLQNDSVLGPLGDVDSLIARMPWRTGGFLASAAMENHIQSFAFVLRDVTPAYARALHPVLPQSRALNDWRDVVWRQETRLARIAARSGSVGSLWFSERPRQVESGLIETLLHRARGRKIVHEVMDPSLVAAAELLEEGFPFLKRSLFGRNGHFQDRGQLSEFLRASNYPVPDAS